MKSLSFTSLLIFLFLKLNLLASAEQYFKYLDPIPDAKYVNIYTNLLITPNDFINYRSLYLKGSVSIQGSLSGICNYSIKFDEHTNTFILQPVKHFELGETVTVTFNSVIKKSSGESIKPFSYSFQTEAVKTQVPWKIIYENEFNFNSSPKLPFRDFYTDTDTSFPKISVNYYNGPSRGRFFLSNIVFTPQTPNTPYLIILNNNGLPYHSIKVPVPCIDLQVQSNGNLTFYKGFGNGKYYELDTNYNLVDSFYCGQGDTTDGHELRVLPNRHALLMSYNAQTIDMTGIVSGGHPNAQVIGLIIQEIDENKDVVFRWRSWDHFQITDATHLNLTDSVIDYVHGNAIEIDYDGNLLISSRHMDEITKINRTTGNIIWRLGGKNNQFNFINDPIQFSYQHAIRRLKNGNVTLFDNGNYHSPSFSRAVEYKLDEVNKTATLVWQYRNYPDIYGFAMGNVQRLDNGNTLISWGSTNPTITEVKYDGTKVLEISLPQNVYTYRTFKYSWKMYEPEGNLVPANLVLEQNYPNPFNSSTTIRFGIPYVNSDRSPVNTKLAVYDMLGREVSVLVNEKMLPDSYKVDFIASNLSSGVYFYKLAAGGFTVTKRMVFLK